MYWQAFTLLLIADVLVGYHSSDGWITAINLVFHHYGLPEKEEFTSIFVAIVPVSLDVTFKYWVFKCAPSLTHPPPLHLRRLPVVNTRAV